MISNSGGGQKSSSIETDNQTKYPKGVNLWL